MPQMPYFEKAKIIFLTFFIAFITYFIGDNSAKLAIFLTNQGIDFPLKDLINFILIFALYKFFIAKTNLKAPITELNPIICAIFGALIMALWIIITWAILISFNIFTFKKAYLENWQNQLLIGGFFIIIHALNEQLILQKIIRPYIGNSFSQISVVFIGAFSFAFVQFLQNYNAPIYILNSLLIGANIMLISNKFGLWGAVFAHASWSFIELIAMPNLYKYELQKHGIFFTGSDSYGTIILSLTGIVLFLVLLLFKSFSYKANYDKKQP